MAFQEDLPIGKLPTELFLDIAGLLDPYSLIQLFLSCRSANLALQPTVQKRARQHALPSAELYNKRFIREADGTITPGSLPRNSVPRERLVNAIQGGRLNVVANYLNAGVNPNAVCLYGARMLNISIRSLRTDIADLLLSHGADPSLPNLINPITPLNQALRIVTPQISNHFVRTLITAGADLSPPGTIHGIFRNSPLPTVLLAISKGASIHQLDPQGSSTLHWVGRDPTKLAFLSQSAPELIPLRNKAGETALHVAIHARSEPFALNLFRTLRNTPNGGFTANTLNATNRANETALHLAITLQMESLAMELINSGIRLDIRSASIGTELHYAVDRDLLDVARRLIIAGVDVNFQATAGYTPLMRAVLSQNPWMVELLVDNGRADLGVRCNAGLTAAHLAFVTHFEAGWEYLTIMGG